ncbi:MAG TPA: ParA family protein [Armatimonadota bacterium]
MARIIAVINQKGGVGKTTTAVNLAAALAAAGKRVVVLDLDPRADLTSYLGLTPAEGHDSVYESLFGEGAPLPELLTPLAPKGLFGLPASGDLVGAEMLLMNTPAAERAARFVEPLQALAERYDFLLIDSPPGLQMLSIGALSAAREVIIPQQCSFLALHGLRQITENIERMQTVNPRLRLCGILLTMRDQRTVHSRQVVEMVREGFAKSVFETVIPFSVRYQEAAAAGQPIAVYAPGSTQAEAYAAVAAEVLARRPR